MNKVDVAHAAGWRVGERVQRKETAEQGTLLEVLDANSVVEMSGGEKFVVPTKDACRSQRLLRSSPRRRWPSLSCS